MKAVLIILGSCCLLIGLIGSYQWDSAQNHGNTFGYYGEYNGVSNALASIPGVTVTGGWHNHDVTLEEFGFDIRVAGKPVRLLFSETDPIRRMKRDAAISALQLRIKPELDASGRK